MRLWMTAALAALGFAGAAAAATGGYGITDRVAGPDGGWDYVQVDTHNNRVLVTRGGSVMAMDIASGKVTPGLAPGARLHIALPLNAGAELLVTNGGTDTAVFTDPQGKALASVPTAKGPDAAILEPRSGLVLVMGHAGGAVTLVDPKARKSVGEIPVGGALEEAAVDGSGRAFVNIEDKNEIAVLDVAARKVTTRYALLGCEGPTGLTYDAQDRLLIAACDGATELVAVDTGRVVQTLPTGKGADGVAYDAKRHRAFVPAGRDGTLSVIALEGGKGRIVQTLATRKSARTIGLDPRSGRVYLPAAQYVAAAGGGRPTMTPGSFEMLVVSPQ